MPFEHHILLIWKLQRMESACPWCCSKPVSAVAGPLKHIMRAISGCNILLEYTGWSSLICSHTWVSMTTTFVHLCMCLYVCAIEKTSTISWNIRKMSDKMAITSFPNWQLWQENEKNTKMLTNRNFLLKTPVSVLQFQPALPQFLQQMED